VYGKVLDDRGSIYVAKSVDKIRVENKGWKVTGEQNAKGGSEGCSREWGDHIIAGGVQVLRRVIYGTNMYDL